MTPEPKGGFVVDHPAIIVPYRDRKLYLDRLLACLPAYLESQGILQYQVVVSEQVDKSRFNLATSRNVRAAFALSENFGHDYFIFHDVDILPLKNVDYRRPRRNVLWFMNAGSCKILRDSLIRSNGYNNDFVGWGHEDTEFGLRLCAFDCPSFDWHSSREAEEAEIVNLEFAGMSGGELESASKRYFGWTNQGPRFVFHKDLLEGLVPTDKRGWEPPPSNRNARLLDWIRRLSPELAREYFGLFGLSQLHFDRVSKRQVTPSLWWLTYDRNEVLEA